jgi:hypothetical protein
MLHRTVPSGTRMQSISAEIRKYVAAAIVSCLGAAMFTGTASARPIILLCNMDNGDFHKMTFDERAHTVNGHEQGDTVTDDGYGKFMGQDTNKFRRHRVNISDKSIEAYDGLEEVLANGSRIQTASTDITVNRATGEIAVRQHDALLNGIQVMQGRCATDGKKSSF